MSSILDSILGQGDTTLRVQKSYGIMYRSGMWQAGKDFHKAGYMGGYFSIQNTKALKDLGYTHIEVVDNRWNLMERIEL